MARVFSIVVVDDNDNIRHLMATYLKREGYRPFEAVDAQAALAILEKEQVDLMITDIMMPGMDGYTLTENIRAARYDFPILMVTAKERIADKRRGFLAGTDDYMVKPIDFDEMVLRVAALLRRAKINTEKQIQAGDAVLDYLSFTVCCPGVEVELPQKEFLLLFKLLSYPNRIFTRRELMDELWGYDTDSEERTVDVHIKRLRDKFGAWGQFDIVTIRGLGYKAVKNV